MITITFEHSGREYRATFQYVSQIPMKHQIFYLRGEMGAELGKLYIANGKWRFDDNTDSNLSELADFFGDYITAWFE